MKIFLSLYFTLFFFIIICSANNESSKNDNLYINKEKEDDNKKGNILNNKEINDTSQDTKDEKVENITEDANKLEDNYNESYYKLEKDLLTNLGENIPEKSENIPEKSENTNDTTSNNVHNNIKPDASDFNYYNEDNDDDDDDRYDNENELSSIWNKNMQNFEPSTLLTFEISGNSEEYIYEEINMINTYFRGVFYSNNESDEQIIEFLITDPDGVIIYKKEANEGIFYFYTKKIGIYTLTLKNNKWVGKKLTTVAIGLGENLSLKSDHIKDFAKYIEEIVSETKKLKNEIKYLSFKHMMHIEKMKKITNKAFLYCFIKLFVLIFLSFFTIHYIKKLVSNKRVL